MKRSVYFEVHNLTLVFFQEFNVVVDIMIPIRHFNLSIACVAIKELVCCLFDLGIVLFLVIVPVYFEDHITSLSRLPTFNIMDVMIPIINLFITLIRHVP